MSLPSFPSSAVNPEMVDQLGSQKVGKTEALDGIAARLLKDGWCFAVSRSSLLHIVFIVRVFEPTCYLLNQTLPMVKINEFIIPSIKGIHA